METKIEGEEAMEMFKMVKQAGMLPAKMDELMPLSFIGRAAVTFYKAKIKAMNQLKMTESQRKATLRDGQDAGEMLLDIEARIGQLLPSREEIRDTVKKNLKKGPVASDEGVGKLLPEGLDKGNAYKFRAIAENPEIVEKIKAQARENEDIPTKTAVLNAISAEREKASRKKEKEYVEDSRTIIALEESSYLLALEQCIRLLPQRPPKAWSGEALKQAKAYAKIIIKRLGVFQ